MDDALTDHIAQVRAREGDAVEDWLAGLSGLIAELTQRWELTLGAPFDGGSIGYTVAATRAGTDPVVLKISAPGAWFTEETGALVHWDGHGAVELIDHDPRGAQLLERAVPGTSLREEPDEDRAMELAAGVLERLWVAPPASTSAVADEVLRWADTMAERNDTVGARVPPGLVDTASKMLRDLTASQREQVLLHGDLHLGNVLAAQREPWLAIDPKPLVGEREFDVTALIRDGQEELVEDEDAPARLQRRFDRLSERLDCDRRRLKDWSVAIMTDYALWSFESGAQRTGVTQVAVAQLLRRLRP